MKVEALWLKILGSLSRKPMPKALKNAQWLLGDLFDQELEPFKGEPALGLLAVSEPQHTWYSERGPFLYTVDYSQSRQSKTSFTSLDATPPPLSESEMTGVTCTHAQAQA